jgi:hypothetical protein
MADKFKDSLSFLTDDQEDKPARSSKSRGRRTRFNTGLEEISATEAAKATGSKSMAGQYKRYTVYLSPETIQHFKRMAKSLELSQAEAARWVFQYMLEEFDNGVRPEMEEVVVRRRLKR